MCRRRHVLNYHHTTLACESRGGGGGRDSRCGSRVLGRTSNGLLSQIDMGIWNAIRRNPMWVLARRFAQRVSRHS
jgi:hypothetical protein